MKTSDAMKLGCVIELVQCIIFAMIMSDDRFGGFFSFFLIFIPVTWLLRWIMHKINFVGGIWDLMLGPVMTCLALLCAYCFPDPLADYRSSNDKDNVVATESADKSKSEKAAKDPAQAVTSAATATPPIPEVSLEEALAELDALTGLENVKREMRKLANKVKIDEKRRAEGLNVAPRSLHMVFTGNPGTGKTTVARIVAKIFRALGLLKTGQLIETDRSGLIAGYSGQTAERTAKVVESARGGVLFIDEAYQLVNSNNDDYGKEAVTTLLKRMEDLREELIVIVAGYTDEMRIFLDSNSGFRSRFALEFEFADFTNAELAKIFRSNVAKAQYTLSPELDEQLEKLMDRIVGRRDRTFGNGRFVRQLFEAATARQADRLANFDGDLDKDTLQRLEISDLGVGERHEDPRAPSLEEALAELDALTGLKEVKEEVHRLAATVKANRMRAERGIETAKMSYNFIFTGNPGTGKTTVARIIAKIFRALGVLNRGHLVETDRSGLVAEYAGQTAVKTGRLIDSAKGGILFIDEAYQLNQGNGDNYGAEAVATLLKRMEDERGEMVVIVAGYDQEMKRFLEINSGLESRFNRKIHFPDYSAKELAQMFRTTAAKAKFTLSPDVDHWLDAYINMLTQERERNFGNGRWVRNLFEKSVERQAIRVGELANPSVEELQMLRMRDIGISLKDPNASDED